MPLHPIVAQGWVVIDAMDRQQSLDPVDVLDTFVNQPATLTMDARDYTMAARLFPASEPRETFQALRSSKHAVS